MSNKDLEAANYDHGGFTETPDQLPYNFLAASTAASCSIMQIGRASQIATSIIRIDYTFG